MTVYTRRYTINDNSYSASIFIRSIHDTNPKTENTVTEDILNHSNPRLKHLQQTTNYNKNNSNRSEYLRRE